MKLTLLVGLCIVCGLCMFALWHQKRPGVLWKVPYACAPELEEIYAAFVGSCQAPKVPAAWFENTSNNATFQLVRREAQTLSEDAKYEMFES